MPLALQKILAENRARTANTRRKQLEINSPGSIQFTAFSVATDGAAPGAGKMFPFASVS
jgi:hypothetical protein